MNVETLENAYSVKIILTIAHLDQDHRQFLFNQGMAIDLGFPPRTLKDSVALQIIQHQLRMLWIHGIF